jgi:hypothetical protein
MVRVRRQVIGALRGVPDDIRQRVPRPSQNLPSPGELAICQYTDSAFASRAASRWRPGAASA